MIWLIWVSFKRNWPKYWLSIVGLTAAIAVTCVSITSAATLIRASYHPLTRIIGGDLIVMDRETNFTGAPGYLGVDKFFGNFSYSPVAELIGEALPDARFTGSLALFAVMRRYDGRYFETFIMGRAGGTDTREYYALLSSGGWPEKDEQGTIMFTAYGRLDEYRTYRLPVYVPEKDLWDMGQTLSMTFRLAGIYSPCPLGMPPTVPLGTLQNATGGHDLVTWMGVMCRNPLDIEDDKKALQRAFDEKMPDLKVMTVHEIARLMTDDFDKLEETAAYYTPAMIFTSALLVVVTSLAMMHARKRELTMLHVIGLSQRQVRVLFVLECTLAAVAGAVLGTALAVVVTSMFFGGYILTLMPAAVAITTTFLTIVAISGGLKGREFRETLRNP